MGRKVQGALRQLDTFDLPDSTTRVVYNSDEVTSNCPITGQPDWYFVSISIIGTKRGIESKSLKLYLQSFRDDGQFCEAFADTIAKDVLDATNAGSVSVMVRQKPRGGISIEAVSETSDKSGWPGP